MNAPFSALLAAAILFLAASDAAGQGIGASRYSGHRPSYVSSRVWVPGHYETVNERVWVPGPYRREWVAPLYEWRIGPCGARYVCVRAGYWRSVQLPGRYEDRCVRVWRPGQWVARSGRY